MTIILIHLFLASNYFPTSIFGRAVNSLLQFLQIFLRFSAQSIQYVHSKEHSIESELLDKLSYEPHTLI